MVVMTGLLAFGLGQLLSPQEPEASRLGTIGWTVLAMAVTYGLVCGAMMLAGEREAGTLVFLDVFSGRRGLLWLGKLLIGVVLALSEALAVALVLHLLQQAPPNWLQILVGGEVLQGTAVPASRLGPAAHLWFQALPLVTLEAYVWGLLGSALSRRVLVAAGTVAVLAAPFLLVTAFAPPPVFLGVRLVAAATALGLSLAIFLAQSRETSSGPAPRP